MKLRNKKTGEIIKSGDMYNIMSYDEYQDRIKKEYSYNSLAELNDEWEDYEVPELKDHYYIDYDGDILIVEALDYEPKIKAMKQIGNYFETEEEAEKAVEKLKAYTRLKDKGFRFKGYTAQAFGEIKFSIEDDWEDCNFDHLQHKADLDLLFGGEE